MGCNDSPPTHVDMTSLNAALLMVGFAFVLALLLFAIFRMAPQKPYIRARKSRVLSDPAELM
jgi:hypothetical protein